MFKLAIVGRPNVGKSSLFNRLTLSQDAITSEVSGTTRDIKKRVIKLFTKECELIDTGGIEERDELFIEIKKRSIQSAKEADLILYMVDGKTYPDDEDKALYYQLQQHNPNIALVVNKIDNDKRNEIVWEYESFGIDTIFAISVLHNRGITKMIDWIEEHIPDDISQLVELKEDEAQTYIEYQDDEDLDEDAMYNGSEIDNSEQELKDEIINIGIIGRVNVGKSSLLNKITGTQRSVVSPIAGTTIDPVDEMYEYKSNTMKFVDTAGLRRRGKIDGIERYALNRTQKILEASDVALLVLDGSEPIVELDEKIAGLVDKFGLATIIILNKWDIHNKEHKKSIDEIRFRFKFLYFAPIIAVSALHGRSIDKLKDLILKVYKNYTKRVSTSKINNLILKAQQRHQIPSHKGRLVKIYYATQFDIKPPKISVIMNKPQALHFSYKRYLINFIRDNYDYEGVPIRIFTRAKKQMRDRDIDELELY
jgi:GTP-binding protein